jgi:hypothetical protein
MASELLCALLHDLRLGRRSDCHFERPDKKRRKNIVFRQAV